MVVFGTKRLRNISTDLGGVIMGFKAAMKEGDTEGNEKANLETDVNKPKNESA